jgi:membrane-bound lytic murein transglycosylase D
MQLRRTAALLGTLALTLGAGPAAAAQSSDSLTRPTVIPAVASMSATHARPESASDSAAAEPTWDMDVRSYETQDRVAHYVGLFSGRAREHITERLAAGSRYEPMIRAQMKAGGVPEDMYYLALIESGFNPHAYSRAAAVGMWQFMASTARDMGLRVDWWVDERRDPVRSTTAAVRFIRGLREQFGSLYLAAAAYNGGPGRVARGLTKYADDMQGAQGEDAFFVLAEKDYLKNETRDYVPQLIAAALIGKEPARYGMELHVRAPFAYDSVRVRGSTPLAAVATAAGVATAEVSELNPHLLRGMTPPGDACLVRIPVGGAASFDSSFATLPKEDLIAAKTVESKKGDTVKRLAHARGISESALRSFNPRLRKLKSGRLAPGQPILLPTAAVAAAALNVPDPAIEKYPRSTKRMKLHTVRKGETVGAIARKYAITPERIMRLNGLKKPMIFPGQSLIVSGAGKAKNSSAVKKSGARSTARAKTTHKR